MTIYRYNGQTKRLLFLPVKPRQWIVDESTLLWLARMFVGEGGHDCYEHKARIMFYAILNRWMFWDKKRKFKTFLNLIRAFSQPINPLWQLGGKLAIKYHNTEFASPERLKRRAYICQLDWCEISLTLREVCDTIRFGYPFYNLPDKIYEIPKPRLTNWASLPSTPKKYPWGIDIDGDWFFEDKNILNGTIDIIR